MYKDLIKRLRTAAQWADKGLRIPPSLCLEAANVIEELTDMIFGEGFPISERFPDEPPKEE